jgi:hypothetical protein
MVATSRLDIDMILRELNEKSSAKDEVTKLILVYFVREYRASKM